ncbi:ABC transporter permease [Nocardia sp. ET3-3]|uniref:ABC transporter permease n=1 Tax=Nocardia terrae TaxID=2675851 RepID=A0A7K1V5L8_9NOCA|nr:ABC transporter permease [Nocardia terrae]MVU81950.1 ABC transporter permease [Nocardia terrae]
MRFTAVLRSEWIKARSLPVLGGLLALLVVSTVGFSLAGAASIGRHDAGKPGFDALLTSFYGINFGQLAAICVGSVCAAAQFRYGGTRVWFTAVPRRGLVYGANLAVIGAATMAAGLVTAALCFFGGQPLLGSDRIRADDPAAWRAIIGCAIYLSLIALFAAGLATVFRNAMAAMGILVPVVLLLSFTLGDVTRHNGLVQFLPDRAGRQALVHNPSGALGPWTGLAVTALWAAASLWAGWEILRRKDF